MRPAGPSGSPPAPKPSRDTKALALRGAALVAIAVVSSLLWWLIRHEPETTPVADTPSKSGQFQYTLIEGPQVTSDCVSKSYGDTKDFFTQTPCTRLSRALYTTETGGQKALVSVVLVTMPGEVTATQLKALTDKDGTGNVSDLVRDGTFKDQGAPKISGQDAAYDSHVTGPEVAIVLAGFYNKHKDKPVLERIATDALRLSGDLRR
ncbi:hypothetical protein [Amycolatopsis regifaucium]|uniref:Uncharacterized protein n=1 Tax=Amycolatopsis regifaucium TaxID=546365 RepID=A0A154MI22_9PSEU|nr:hypothetical protein [Amycolatopsis regifaucium]KZB83647.1 hypothetical protein AVL48_36235 [Amycolatopsis regifaucium]OKA03835.1 hypothetical protein ATP06_0234020 [Amycolatopsis regifaucium]SFJ66710.1 hypothetical protein SAMN04489731_12941 [Amycolatopsis regifaucium]